MRKLFSLFLVFVICACGNDKSGNSGVIDSPKKDSLAKDSGLVILLPTPLQVSSVMLIGKMNCDLSLISSDTINEDGYETDYSRALNLGIAITDLGYCAVNDKREQALHYLARIKSLVRSLRLDNVCGDLVTRIESNSGNDDSLRRIVLSLYNRTQSMINSADPKIPLYISGGSFLEALSVSLNHPSLKTLTTRDQLLAQERSWTDNQLEAIAHLEPSDDTQDFYNTFYTVQHYFEPFVVEQKDGKPVVKYTDDDLLKLAAKVKQLRDATLRM